MSDIDKTSYKEKCSDTFPQMFRTPLKTQGYDRHSKIQFERNVPTA